MAGGDGQEMPGIGPRTAQPAEGISPVPDEGSDKENMENQKEMLIERMESEFGLLDKLRKNLTVMEIAEVESKATTFEKNKRLLELIFENNKHQDLISALTDTHQTHLVNWVRGNGEYRVEFGLDWPLNKKEIEILCDNLETLTDIVDPCELVGLLFSKKVINKRQMEFIQSKRAKYKQNMELLNILRRCSLTAYYLTIDCLRASNQGHIADILEGRGTVVPAHANLDADQLDEKEINIVREMTSLLLHNNVPENWTNLLLQELQINIIAARRGSSIVLYIYCKTMEELIYLCEVINKKELNNRIENLFNALLHDLLTRVIDLYIVETEINKAKKFFEQSFMWSRMTNLDNEFIRIATFAQWQLNYPSALNLAHAGFVYTGTGDIVTCYKCNCVISDWKETDVPLERHRQHSPNCPFVASHSLPEYKAPPGSPITRPSKNVSIPTDSIHHLSRMGHPAEVSSMHLASAPSQVPISQTSSLQAEDLQTGAHLKLESQRLRTFDSWKNPYVNGRDLAKAGLFFTGIGDCVKCAFCCNILKDWEPGDVPFNEHRKHFPKCPFVLGNVGNCPENRMMHVQHTRVMQPEDSIAATGGGGREGGGGGGRKAYSPLPDYMLHETRNSLNFDVKFADIKQRLRSYENMPLPKGQKREVLAEAGFYYVGPGESVKCFQCGGVLKKWSEMDQPWIEHAKWFPDCVFLLQARGYKFITDIQQQFSGSGVKVERWTAAPTCAANVQRPVMVTHPWEMPASSSFLLPSSSTASLQPSKAADEGIEIMAKENESVKDAIQCKICMDEMANTVFLPCGHLLCCERCAPAIIDCPVCRGIIKGTLKVYVS